MAFIERLEHTPSEIISLEKAKKQLQFDAPSDVHEDDDLILDYIDAAIVELENYINSEILEKRYQVTGLSFADVLQFSKQKITEVESIQYKSIAGDTVVVDAANYSLQNVDDFENEIVFASGYKYPELEVAADAVTMVVKVGYPSGSVPKLIQKALLLIVTSSYEFRTNTVKEKCTTAEHLMHVYKRY